MKSENKKTSYSLWAVFTAFGIFNSVLFYYAGIKSKSSKYIKTGHFYLLLIFFLIFINLNIPFIKNIILFIYLGSYIFGLVFGIKTMPAYQKRLEILKLLNPDDFHSKKIYSLNNQELYELIKNNSFAALENNIAVSVLTTSDSVNSKALNETEGEEYFEFTGEKIKINIDSEEKLTTLPFITEELIRKIILERKLGSGFKNKDDLEKKLGLSSLNSEIISKRIDYSFEK